MSKDFEKVKKVVEALNGKTENELRELFPESVEEIITRVSMNLLTDDSYLEEMAVKFANYERPCVAHCDYLICECNKCKCGAV